MSDTRKAALPGAAPALPQAPAGVISDHSVGLDGSIDWAGLSKLMTDFAALKSQASPGQPFLCRKSNTVSLHYDLDAIQSEMAVDAPDALVLGYTHTMMGFLLFHPAPATLTMIGLGGGSLVKYCHRHLPDCAIVAVENNPQIVALRDTFHIPPDQPRFQVRLQDGAAYLQAPPAPCDVLLIDGFDEHGQPAALCSQEFYDDCYRALADDGIMVVNILGSDPLSPSAIECMTRSFRGAVLVVDGYDSCNKIAFATKGVLSALPNQVIISRLRSLGADHALHLDHTVWALLQQRRLQAAAVAESAPHPATSGGNTSGV